MDWVRAKFNITVCYIERSVVMPVTPLTEGRAGLSWSIHAQLSAGHFRDLGDAHYPTRVDRWDVDLNKTPNYSKSA